MWWFFLLLFLIAVPLAPLVWAMFRVSKLRFADARGQVVESDQAPERVLMNLKEQVEPLIEIGFEYLGMRSESRGESDYWQAFLSSAGGMVWAVAEEPDEIDGARRVSLMSFGSGGSVVITRDGDEVFGEDDPGTILRRDSFASALEQAESHAELLEKERFSVVAMEPEAFLTRYERMAALGLDTFFKQGWLYESKDQSVKVSPVKLPQMAIAWLRCQLKVRAREKAGSSWLLVNNFNRAAEVEPSSEELPIDEESMVTVEEVADEVSEEILEEVSGLPEIPVPAEAYASSELSEIDESAAIALAANERAMQTPRMEAMPVGAIDEPLQDESLEDEIDLVAEELIAEEAIAEEAIAEEAIAEEAIAEEAIAEKAIAEEAIAEEAIAEKAAVAEEPAIVIPEEDGLPRDWALYQQQAAKKSLGYWLGGFGGQAFLFLSVLVFAIWMAFAGGWGLRVVLFGLIALLVHEAGHALVMLVRRSWDWSHFLIPIPRAMSAKQWPIKGGWQEFLTIMAGPVPGLLFGWIVLIKTDLGAPTSDFVLDFALAAMVVNSVSLLPFLPLDGGRLLDLAFLRRAPQLRIFGLVLAGLVFLGLAFVGGGILAGVLALLMWASVPSAFRKSKLLPWFRSNAKEEGERQVVTAFNIARERSQHKAFKGSFGIARLDELMGLGQAKRLGLLGGAMALGVLVLTWISPFALPVYSVVISGKKWYETQQKVQAQSEKLLGALSPLSSAKSDSEQKEAQKNAKADLAYWQERLAKQPSQPEEVFSETANLNTARKMRWRFAAHWIAESPDERPERHVVAREAARALRREAIRAADNGDKLQAFRDLGSALQVITECEPRHSLEAWVSWLELEREILKEVENVSSRYSLDDTYIKWYESALAQCPRPTNSKIAGLILAESQGFESLVKQLDVHRIAPQEVEGGPGRKFLSSLTGVGELISVEPLLERQLLAAAFAKASTLEEAMEDLRSANRLPLEVEASLQRIENNYSFRQVAMSALKVKRVGISGASQELAQLQKDYGFTARLDETDERKALKLSRLNPAGEVVEMEWLLQQ